jgi:hypothetical protein
MIGQIILKLKALLTALTVDSDTITSDDTTITVDQTEI